MLLIKFDKCGPNVIIVNLPLFSIILNQQFLVTYFSKEDNYCQQPCLLSILSCSSSHNHCLFNFNFNVCVVLYIILDNSGREYYYLKL